MVYLKLQSDSQFARQDVIFKPEEFKIHLESIFQTGSKLFERSIVRELRNQFDLDLQNSFDLIGAIQQSKEIVTRSPERLVVS